MPARSKSVAKKKKASREIVVPDKLYFRIGDVSELLQLPTYVLRFWETEFPQLKPTKSSSGQRMYRRREVELALRIRSLLYEEGFTIPGARERLKSESAPSKNQSALPFPKSDNGGLKRVRQELQEILKMLSGKVKVEARKAPRTT
ncbi:MAG: MerR family transcriptional regulator [Terriglobales bacterium]